MSDLHPLSTPSGAQNALEAVSAEFLTAGLWIAREKTVAVVLEIRDQLKIGMTEDQARQLVLACFSQHGVTKHWHRPYVRFGEGTLLTFNDPIRENAILAQDDPYYLDVGPVWTDKASGIEYEGDYGDTFILGDNAEGEKCAEAARSLFQFAQRFWREKKCSGQELYRILDQETSARGYCLVKDVEGHRLADFPHHRYTKMNLADADFVPSPALWVLEVKINHPTLPFGAFFEDILS